METFYTAFAGTRLLISGDLENMLRAVKTYLDSGAKEPALIFDDENGKQLDFDFRGSEGEILARVIPGKSVPGPGRPRLGVVCGEVSLLPRHWDWLERQQHNVSGTIRRMVDEAIKHESPQAKARYAIEATDRELWVLAGNLADCEEASRALYAGDFGRFEAISRKWPADVAEHLVAMAAKGKEI